MAENQGGGTGAGQERGAAEAAEIVGTDSEGRAGAAVRALCVNGELSRAIIGYGDDSEEAYQNAVAEARAFCRHHGGTQKITRL